MHGPPRFLKTPPRFPKIPQDSPFRPLRGRLRRPGPPAPPCVLLFSFSPSPPPGRGPPTPHSPRFQFSSALGGQRGKLPAISTANKVEKHPCTPNTLTWCRLIVVDATRMRLSAYTAELPLTGLRGCSVDRTTGATRLPASGQMLEHLLMLIGQANVGSTCSTNFHILTSGTEV